MLILVLFVSSILPTYVLTVELGGSSLHEKGHESCLEDTFFYMQPIYSLCFPWL
jgi:hypothetical protein